MKTKLSESLKYWRAERPDEWQMDEFIRNANILESKLYEKEIDMDVLKNEKDTLQEGVASLMAQAVLLKEEIKSLGKRKTPS